MVKTDHAHVEAALLALGLVVIFGLIDVFVNAWDDEPLKQIGYLAIYLIVYFVAYAFRKRAWGR